MNADVHARLSTAVVISVERHEDDFMVCHPTALLVFQVAALGKFNQLEGILLFVLFDLKRSTCLFQPSTPRRPLQCLIVICDD